MLPIDLLVTRARKGRIRPSFAPLDFVHLELASALIEIFGKGLGKKKGEVLEGVKRYEDVGFDYRLVRGLALLLERRCVFETKSFIDPHVARKRVFEEASKLSTVTSGQREAVLEGIAKDLGMGVEELEMSLWADLEEELVLKSFDHIGPRELLRRYNLSLAQTLLFRSTSFKFTVGGNWKGIFRRIKQLGLMYSAETVPDGLRVTVDGPLSLLRMTDRYGTAVAKLLPEVVRSERWGMGADVVLSTPEGRKRILKLELDVEAVRDLIETDAGRPMGKDFDSSVEESFYRRLAASRTGWRIVREPTALVAGDHVMIPDFSFEKGNLKVYMEIMGFWTKDYLDRKLQKLSHLAEVDMIVAVNKRLACSDVKRVAKDVILYDKEVPLRPVVERLRAREEGLITAQVKALEGTRLRLKDDVVRLKDLAREFGVLEEALRRVLSGGVDGYKLVGDELVNQAKLADVERKIEGLSDRRLSHVIRLVEGEGLESPFDVLDALGYDVRWKGLDQDRSTVYKVRNS